MTTTPAERLTAAANWLDERVSSATIGPWSVSDPILDVGGERGFDVDGPHGGYVSRLSDAHDAHYIATMHPEVGKMLASWLRCEALNRYEGRSPKVQSVLAGETANDDGLPVEPAVVIADLILGGAA